MSTQNTYSLMQRADISPGWPADSTKKNGRTRSARTRIQYGAAVQIDANGMAEPLVPGGVFMGIAAAARLSRDEVGEYEQFDNVPVEDAGTWWEIADKAFAAGVGLNWNSTTGRWTDAVAGGAIVSTPGVEADQAANGNGHLIKIKIRRKR